MSYEISSYSYPSLRIHDQLRYFLNICLSGRHTLLVITVSWSQMWWVSLSVENFWPLQGTPKIMREISVTICSNSELDISYFEFLKIIICLRWPCVSVHLPSVPSWSSGIDRVRCRATPWTPASARTPPARSARKSSAASKHEEMTLKPCGMTRLGEIAGYHATSKCTLTLYTADHL